MARGFKTVTEDLAVSLKLIWKLLELNQPRLVDNNFLDWVHLYVDASYEPDGRSGLGGALFDSTGACIGYFSERVDQHLLDSLMRAD